MAPTIARFTGIVPPMPYMGSLPGGGYQGRTKRLDRAVMRAATWLADTFTREVQVRFNSDRLSGLAVCKVSGAEVGDKYTHEFGYGAGLEIPKNVRRRRQRLWTKGRIPRDLQWENCWNEQTPLYYNVLIHKVCLVDPADLGQYTKADPQNQTFGYWTIDTPAEARKLIVRKLRPQFLPQKGG